MRSAVTCLRPGHYFTCTHFYCGEHRGGETSDLDKSRAFHPQELNKFDRAYVVDTKDSQEDVIRPGMLGSELRNRTNCQKSAEEASSSSGPPSGVQRVWLPEGPHWALPLLTSQPSHTSRSASYLWLPSHLTDTSLSPQGLCPSWSPFPCSVSHSTARVAPDRTFACLPSVHTCASLLCARTLMSVPPGEGLASGTHCCLSGSWNSETVTGT